MRRMAALALIALLALPLAGCWSRVEVNDLAIVTLMALDRTEEGNVKVWYQVSLPSQAGGATTSQGGGKAGPSFISLAAEGRTISEAARRVQMQLSRRLFLAHLRVVLVGEELARSGMGQVLDFLTRNREMRLNNYLLTVRGRVEDIISVVPNLEKYTAEYLRELSRFRIGVTTTVGEFARDMNRVGTEPVTGVAAVAPVPPGAPMGQNPGVRLAGSALYQGDKLVGFMDEQSTRGLQWLRGEVRRGVVSVKVPNEEGYVVVDWGSVQVRHRVRVEGGRPVIYIEAYTEGDIVEETVPLDLSKSEMLREVGRGLEREILDRTSQALAEMRRLNVDGARLGAYVHRQKPAVWRGIQSRWRQEGFRQTKVVLKVEAHVRRTSLSTKSRASGSGGGEPR